jgi:hypothetical protein
MARSTIVWRWLDEKKGPNVHQSALRFGGDSLTHRSARHLRPGQINVEQIDSKRLCQRLLCRGEEVAGDAGHQNGYPGQSKDHLLEDFQPFPLDVHLCTAEACHVAARPRQALHESADEWIDASCDNDRYGSRDGPRGARGDNAFCKDNVNSSIHQRHRKLRQAGNISIAPLRDQHEIASLHPTATGKSAQERPEVASGGGAARRKPIRRIRSGCCACAESGQVAAAPPSSVMNSRRFS